MCVGIFPSSITESCAFGPIPLYPKGATRLAGGIKLNVDNTVKSDPVGISRHRQVTDESHRRCPRTIEGNSGLCAKGGTPVTKEDNVIRPRQSTVHGPQSTGVYVAAVLGSESTTVLGSGFSAHSPRFTALGSVFCQTWQSSVQQPRVRNSQVAAVLGSQISIQSLVFAAVPCLPQSCVQGLPS